ncbi:hypothetical protein KCP91_03635 [Microvirga sp. SRT01]|uniref:Uncharacterized protein n=1 Tax=Sphingomonas longa TaxID=2778730 RepID=A0ABS2D3F9_9SPHN|nr:MULTISPECIES: hypothetical protein [Alphaproteobacteria]MBM6575447.1 hypothetical protein [Sphingomonas sp. BT552]MBR7708495.1 hypothetical protein [Microvirga sp. SRT01]
MPDSFASFVNNPSAPSVRFVPVVKAEVDLPGGTCKALLARVAGTANLVDAEGRAGRRAVAAGVYSAALRARGDGPDGDRYLGAVLMFGLGLDWATLRSRGGG